MNEIFEAAMEMMALGMMVVPTKEIDLEVEAPVLRSSHQKMTRGERRRRTEEKAKSRACQDRKARKLGWDVGSDDLGRYFKAKAEVGGVYRDGRISWENDLPAHEDLKRNRVAKQRADIKLGLAEYYEGDMNVTETPWFSRYEVVVDGGNGHFVTRVTETYKEADAIASKQAQYVEDIQEELKELNAKIESLQHRIEMLKRNYPVQGGNRPTVLLVGINGNNEAVGFRSYFG